MPTGRNRHQGAELMIQGPPIRGLTDLLDVGGNLVTVGARIDNLTDRQYWSSLG